MRWLTWNRLDGYADLGLLIMRVGLGLMMMGHGWPKVAGGPDVWAKLGGAMSAVGVDFAPTLWGGAAAFTELVGGAMLVIGLGTRPAALLLTTTMAVAAAMHWDQGDGFRGMSHAAEDGIVFLALILLGPGKWSLDRRIH